jgi:Putative transposase.
MADLLFRAACDTLLELLGDGAYLGGSLGIIASLHTWGRSLNFHPHVHCLVTGGGLVEGEAFRPVANGFLLPVRVVKWVFRRKMLSVLHRALNGGELQLPAGESRQCMENLFNKLNCKNWHVHLRERYAHGRGVMRYLARYIKGGPTEQFASDSCR